MKNKVHFGITIMLLIALIMLSVSFVKNRISEKENLDVLIGNMKVYLNGVKESIHELDADAETRLLLDKGIIADLSATDGLVHSRTGILRFGDVAAGPSARFDNIVRLLQHMIYQSDIIEEDNMAVLRRLSGEISLLYTALDEMPEVKWNNTNKAIEYLNEKLLIFYNNCAEKIMTGLYE